MPHNDIFGGLFVLKNVGKENEFAEFGEKSGCQ